MTKDVLPWRRRAATQRSAADSAAVAKERADERLGLVRRATASAFIAGIAAAIAALSAGFSGYQASIAHQKLIDDRIRSVAQLRPYVSFEFTDTQPVRSPAGHLMLPFKIANRGQTPARNFRMSGLITAAGEEDSKIPPPPALGNAIIDDLAAGQVSPQFITLSGMLERYGPALNTGRRVLVFQVSYSYQDAFDNAYSGTRCYMLLGIPRLEDQVGVTSCEAEIEVAKRRLQSTRDQKSKSREVAGEP